MPIAGERLGHLAQVFEDHAKIVEQTGLAWFDSEGLSIATNGFRKPAGLMGQNPQHVLSLGVISVGLDDLPIEPFRLRQFPALVQAHSLFEHL